MTESFQSSAEAHEASVFADVIKAARARQQAAQQKSAATPRFILDGAESMAAHMALSDQQVQDSLEPAALWQLYVPSTLSNSATPWDFAALREKMPWSYERLRSALAEIDDRPQLVGTVFHMAAFPLISTLLGAVWRDMCEGPLHLLVASRNMSWLRLGNNRWIEDHIELVGTDGPGLRKLLAGLKDGSIRRLLILADGPQAPGAPGTRALSGVSPTLGIRTTLLSKIYGLGIPIVPITHEWEAERPLVTPQAMLDPAVLSEAETLDALAGHIERLLHRRPEQWLNWSAARIRT